MSGIEDDMEAGHVDLARILGNAEDGGRMLLRHIVIVERRMSEVAALLRGAGPGAARAVARLNFEWSTLEAWLEFFSATETTPESVGRLWALPALARARTKLRRLLQVGAAYGQEQQAPLAVVAQLCRLGGKLKAHEGIVAGLLNEGPDGDAHASSVAMYGGARELGAQELG
jgi:hypothetical protein